MVASVQYQTRLQPRRPHRHSYCCVSPWHRHALRTTVFCTNNSPLLSDMLCVVAPHKQMTRVQALVTRPRTRTPSVTLTTPRGEHGPSQTMDTDRYIGAMTARTVDHDSEKHTARASPCTRRNPVCPQDQCAKFLLSSGCDLQAVITEEIFFCS